MSLSPSPGMPVDVHSSAFRLWQIQNGSSFHGCIQNLYINNELQDFTKTQMKPGVVPGCEPCKKIYCVHGICQPDGVQGPVCHCQPGWSGPQCDQPVSNPCQGSKYVSKWNIYLYFSAIFLLHIVFMNSLNPVPKSKFQYNNTMIRYRKNINIKYYRKKSCIQNLMKVNVHKWKTCN